MACLSRYIDVEYLSDDAPLLSSLPDTYSHCVLSQFSLYHTSRFSVAFSQVLVREGRECYAELLYSSLHTSLEIVISSGKVKQRTAPPALRNSLTGDTQTLYPQCSRMRPTREGQAGITMTLPTTTEFAQKVSASSNSSTRGSGTSRPMIVLLARSHAAGLMMACRVSSGEKLMSKW